MYGDLGRNPLYISRYVRMLKYWFKLLYKDTCVGEERANLSAVVYL